MGVLSTLGVLWDMVQNGQYGELQCSLSIIANLPVHDLAI
jgi:hypothetical protein